MSKNYKDADELLKEIQQEDPTYQPDTNVFKLRPSPDIINIIPVPFQDMEKESPKPTEFIINPFLPMQGIAFIYAATGLGKTLFTLNLAYAIAGGGSFLKYFCPLPRCVLYVDGEMAYNQLHSRIMQISKQQGELDFKNNLMFLTPDKLSPFRVPMIDDPIGQEIYVKIIQKYNFDLIIFDNLSMLTSLDENKANEWKPVQDWFLYLRSLGKSIITLHHSGKDTNGYRGSSRMLDCADTAISLQPVNQDGLEDENVKGKKFKIVYQKARAFGGKDALPFEVTLENSIWTYRSMDQTDMDKVIEMFGMGMKQRDISKELILSLSKVNRLLKKARQLGLLPN
jgi:hypothetical protein